MPFTNPRHFSRGLKLRIRSKNSQLCCLLQTPESQAGLNNLCPALLKGVPACKRIAPKKPRFSFFIFYYPAPPGQR